MKRNIPYYFAFFLMLAMMHQVKGQNFKVTYSNTVVYDNYYQIINGSIHPNEIILEPKNFGLNQWKITVQATLDFTNNTGDQISPDQFYLWLNEGNGNPDVPLGLDEVEIFQSDVSSDGRLLSFDFGALGGEELLDLPAGTYTAQLVFHLYDLDNPSIPVETTAREMRFDKSDLGKDGNHVIALEAGADSFTFSFIEVNDYLNDMTMDFPGGLTVSSNKNYQIMVKSSNEAFTSTTTNETIPISILNLEAMAVNPQAGITVEPVVISSVDQMLIEAINPPKDMEFDLTYTIPGGSIPGDVQAGIYSGYLIFSIVPE